MMVVELVDDSNKHNKKSGDDSVVLFVDNNHNQITASSSSSSSASSFSLKLMTRMMRSFYYCRLFITMLLFLLFVFKLTSLLHIDIAIAMDRSTFSTVSFFSFSSSLFHSLITTTTRSSSEDNHQIHHLQRHQQQRSLRALTTTSIKRKVNVAVVAMVKDDPDILPYWLDYHSTIFGIENIAIIDHDSHHNVTRSILQEWQQTKGLKVTHTKASYLLKGNLTYKAFKDYFPLADIYLPLDIDEFVINYDPSLQEATTSTTATSSSSSSTPSTSTTTTTPSPPRFNRTKILEAFEELWIQANTNSNSNSNSNSNTIEQPGQEQEQAPTSPYCWGMLHGYNSFPLTINDTLQMINSSAPYSRPSYNTKKIILNIPAFIGLDHGNHCPYYVKENPTATTTTTTTNDTTNDTTINDTTTTTTTDNNNLIIKPNKKCSDCIMSETIGLLHYHFRNPLDTAKRAIVDLIGLESDIGMNSKANIQNIALYGKKLKYIRQKQLPGRHKARELLCYLQKNGLPGLLQCMYEIFPKQGELVDFGTIEDVVKQIQST